MMKPEHYRCKKRIIAYSSILIIFIFLLSACSNFPLLPSGDSANNFQLAEVLFQVSLPDGFPDESRLMLEIVDDVTGIYFNAARYEMVKLDDSHYSLSLLLKVATELKYRYVRVSESAEYEQNGKGQDVRYRILRINGPQIVDDIIAAWPGYSNPHAGGKITGQVIDAANNAPIPNLLVSAGGYQALTSSDGSFILDKLVPGVHNLVIYSMDGAFETFQQGAKVAEGANTPVEVYLNKRPTTTVRFEVRIPRAQANDMPLRFVSNLSTLGNAYAELSSGSAGSAVNYPKVTKISSTQYRIDLELPVGLHLQYKYSFGDGFWNAEQLETGGFAIRDLIIQEDQLIRDVVESFTVPDIGEVNIAVKVPDSTPAQETVYLQLKPFGWMEPLPMIPKGSGVWEFTIFSPLQYTDSMEYRFCRNGMCEIGAGDAASILTLSPLPTSQTLTSVVAEWQGSAEIVTDSSQYLAFDAMDTRPDWITGVEFSSHYFPGWRATIDTGLEYSKSLGGDFVVLTPTWTLEQTDHPTLAAKPGHDLLWQETMTLVNHVTMSGQKAILYPRINYTQGAVNYYASDQWSEEWKAEWFEEYKRFLFNFADLAQILGIEGIIIEEPAVPYLEYAQKSIDREATPRFFSDNQWNELISGIRSRYSGKLIGVMTKPAYNMHAPLWLDQVDIVYVLLSPALEIKEGSVEEIRDLFDLEIEYVNAQIGQYEKPVLIGISYPASDRAIFGLPSSNEHQIVSPLDAVNIDPEFDLQAKIYSAAIQSSAGRDWIIGFISRGYFPYIELQDASSSIYRKPAGDILWFWYHYLLNKAPQ